MKMLTKGRLELLTGMHVLHASHLTDTEPGLLYHSLPIDVKEQLRFPLLQSTSLMHYRRIVALLLGFWLGGGIVMAWFGARSFQTVERTMNGSNPVFAIQTRPMGQSATRMALRYQVAEQNRYFFQTWEYMQLILGVFFFSYMLFGTLEGKFPLGLALILLVVTGIQRFGISPELGNIGKTLDYLPADVATGERAKFWLMHSAYIGCEVLKLGVGAILLALVLRRGRSVDPVNKFDMVDKANHRHVNW